MCSSATGCASARWSWLKKTLHWCQLLFQFSAGLRLQCTNTNVQMTDMTRGNQFWVTYPVWSGIQDPTKGAGKELTWQNACCITPCFRLHQIALVTRGPEKKNKQLEVSKHSYASGIWAWIVDVWPLCGVFERDCGVLAGDTTIGANARMALATCWVSFTLGRLCLQAPPAVNIHKLIALKKILANGPTGDKTCEPQRTARAQGVVDAQAAWQTHPAGCPQ